MQTQDLINSMGDFAKTYFGKSVSLEGKIVSVLCVQGRDNTIHIFYCNTIGNGENSSPLPREYRSYPVNYTSRSEYPQN